MLASCFEVTLCYSQFSSYSVKLIDEKTSGITIDNNIYRLIVVKKMVYIYKFLSQSSFNNCHRFQERTTMNNFLVNTFWAPMVSILTYIPKTDCYIKISEHLERSWHKTNPGKMSKLLPWLILFSAFSTVNHSKIHPKHTLPVPAPTETLSKHFLLSHLSRKVLWKHLQHLLSYLKRIWINQTLTDCTAHILCCKAAY